MESKINAKDALSTDEAMRRRAHNAIGRSLILGPRLLVIAGRADNPGESKAAWLNCRLGLLRRALMIESCYDLGPSEHLDEMRQDYSKKLSSSSARRRGNDQRGKAR